MLQLRLNNKCIQGERVALELIYNNLIGVGFDQSHPKWQLGFDEYLRILSSLLRLKLDTGTQVALLLPETGQVLAQSSIGKELCH
ncbi:MAG TPA: hypothetical protein VLA39_07390 [Marinobacterium sp.]|nr:hypothetical protein [Marinobacterium sp.]